MIVVMQRHSGLFLYPICGGLLGICLHHSYTLILAIVTLTCVPFFVFRRDSMSCILNGLTFSAAFYFAATYPFAFIFGGALAPLWFVLCVVATLAQTLCLWGLHRLFFGSSLPPELFASCWTGFEFLRHYGTRIYDSNGSTLFAIGQLVVDYPLLSQIADLFGVWGLTWLVAFTSGVLFTSIAPSESFRVRFLRMVRVAGVWLLVVCYGYYRTHENSCETKIDAVIAPFYISGATLGPSPEQTLLDDAIREVNSLIPFDSERIIVVWPEGAFRWNNDEQTEFVAFTKASEAIHCLGIGSNDDGRVHNGAKIYYRGNELHHSEKRYLVPFMECAPPGSELLHLAGLLPSIFRPKTCHANRPRAQQCVLDNFELVPAICYDVFFSTSFMVERTQRPLLLCGSFAEFIDESHVLQTISMRQCRLRAIEFRAPLIRSSLGSQSAFISSDGVIIKDLRKESKAEYASLRLDNRRSIYSRFGDGPLLLICLLIGIFWKLSKAQYKASDAETES